MSASLNTEKLTECESQVAKGMARLVNEVTTAGFDIKEVALVLADLADELVLDLASKARAPNLHRSN